MFRHFLRRTAAVIIASLVINLAACAKPVEKPDPGVALHAFFEVGWEWKMQEYPTWASLLGDERYNDRLADESLAAIERRRQHDRYQLATLRAMDRAGLSEVDRLSCDLFEYNLEMDIAAQAFATHLMPVDQRNGPQLSLPGLLQVTRFRNEQDYLDYLARLRQAPEVIAQIQARMARGLAAGWMPPAIILEKLPQQISGQIDGYFEELPLYKPFLEMPGNIAPEQQEHLREVAFQILGEEVFAALRTLRTYVVDEYIPGARSDVGAWALPDGPAYYAYLVRRYTTTDLTPGEIHQIGLDEVARIRREMDTVIAASGFTGNFEQFIHFLRTDPQFYYDDAAELLRGYRDICKRADYALAPLFGTLPRTPYGVLEIPDYEAPTTTTAYYLRGAADGSRAGAFYANTYKLDSRPKYEMEPLALHEAVPGHHLQITLAQELTGLPRFRALGGYTAFVEGWGLYAEGLGEEMGFYADPYSKFGQLTYEMWRAVRLVVDTGMHARGWTRREAIDYFTANSGKTEYDIVQEIDRYIAWPGQALAYKVGELKIKELRARSEAAMGDDFDIRRFHDQVLGRGALPLAILEQGIDEWLRVSIR